MKRFPTLERYNQILWAVIGSGLLAIVVISLAIMLLAALSSLFKSHRGGVPVTVIEEQQAQEGEARSVQYDFCQPETVYGSADQYIRVVSNRFVVHKKLKFASSDYYSDDESGYGSCNRYGYSTLVNVLLRRMPSGEMQLLLPSNAVIDTLEYPQDPKRSSREEDAEPFPPAGVLYLEATFSDSNGDGVIDEQDDSGAYLADLDGRNLQRITPPNSRVLDKVYDKSRDILTLRILKETNGDRIIDGRDIHTLLEVKVGRRTALSEVLDTTTLQGLMKQAEPSHSAAK